MSMQNKLKNMTGKVFRYKLENHTVKGWKVNDNTVEIETNIKTLTIPKNEIHEFFENFIEVKETSGDITIPTEAITKMQKGYKDTALGLKSVLLDSIDKLAEDSKYIKQAEAINKSVNTLLNVVKLELQMVKMANSNK